MADHVPLTDEELAEIAAGHMRYSPTCMRLLADLRAARAEVKRLRPDPPPPTETQLRDFKWGADHGVSATPKVVLMLVAEVRRLRAEVERDRRRDAYDG